MLLIYHVLCEAGVDATQCLDLTRRFGRNQSVIRIGPVFYAAKRLSDPLVVRIHKECPQMILR
jgi:hypothetical protein